MKLLVCCVITLAVVSLGQCLSNSEELMAVKVDMIKNYLRERQAMTLLTEKVESICVGYGSKFEGVLIKVQECIDLIDEDNETMCSAVKNHFEKCSKPLVRMLEECLPERSQELPSTLIKSVLSATDYLCKTDGEHIFELSNPCARSQNYRTHRCIRKIENQLRQYNSTVPSKDEVCRFMSSFRGCFESHLHFSCGHTRTREAFLNLYDAIKAPCQSQSNVILNEVDDMEATYAPQINWGINRL